MRDIISVAKAIAIAAHKGQIDKNGEPYIEHPTRVVGYLRVGDPELIAVGWLHDVLEDSDVDRLDLLESGMPLSVVKSVEFLTRTDDVEESDYYERIRWNDHARAVKLADIRDNTDPRRLVLLDEKTQLRLIRKYAKALHAIHGTTPKEQPHD